MSGWTLKELAALREMRARGLSQGACAAALGRSRGAVQGALRRMGLTGEPDAHRGLKYWVRAAVARWGVTGAAWRCGVSRASIYAALARKSGGGAGR